MAECFCGGRGKENTKEQTVHYSLLRGTQANLLLEKEGGNDSFNKKLSSHSCHYQYNGNNSIGIGNTRSSKMPCLAFTSYFHEEKKSLR